MRPTLLALAALFLALALPAGADPAADLGRLAASYRPLPMSASAEQEQVLRSGWHGSHPALERHLEANRAALDGAARAAEGKIRFIQAELALPYKLPDYARLVGLVQSLALRSLYEAARGRDREALQDVIAALSLGRGLRQDPLLAGQVAGDTGQAAGYQAVAAWLSESEVGQEVLLGLPERLETLAPSSAELEAAVRQEILAAKKLVAEVSRDPRRAEGLSDESIELLSRLGRAQREATFTEFSRLANAWSSTLTRSARRFDLAGPLRINREMEESLRQRSAREVLSSPPPKVLAAWLAAGLLPDFPPAFEAAGRAQAWAAAAGTVARVRTYVDANGSLPETLQEAAPGAPSSATWEAGEDSGLLTLPAYPSGHLTFHVSAPPQPEASPSPTPSPSPDPEPPEPSPSPGKGGPAPEPGKKSP